jgi:hypothetical protein
MVAPLLVGAPLEVFPPVVPVSPEQPPSAENRATRPPAIASAAAGARDADEAGERLDTERRRGRFIGRPGGDERRACGIEVPFAPT